MKKTITIICVSLFFLSFKTDGERIQKHDPSEIIGTYMNEEMDAKVRIFMAMNDKYSGKVEWMKEPNEPDGKRKLDYNNPNKSKRDRERLGLVLLKNFTYDPTEDRWQGGTVYDPKVGRKYSGYMKFAEGSTNTLNLRGYVMGMPFLGRTAVWTRVK